MNTQLTKSGEFESIKKTLSKVSKTIYKTDLTYNAISLLEKSARTGRVIETEESVPKKSKPRANTPLYDVIKHHHKISDGVQIYQLPKLPFGAHKSYNEDRDFVESHFKFDDQENGLAKNLEDFKRKFKLFDKNIAKSLKSYRGKNKGDASPKCYVFKTKAGLLYCPKAYKESEIYEKDRAQYKNKNYEQKIKPTTKSPNCNQKISSISKSAQETLIERLCPSRQAAESPVSQFYTTKYSQLFTSPENPRPNTSFKIHPVKMSKISVYF